MRLGWLFLCMNLKQSLYLVACALIAGSSIAAAQTPPSSSATAAPSPTNCAPTQSTTQGDVAPLGNTADKQSEPLADKLAKSDGVLCPPTGVDPAIRAPTPNTGNTPVIPPPGSPGGDPTIRPK